MVYQFFQDGGHGWIKVPIKELEKLGITDKISGCSYMRNNFAYLEEDCDLNLFFEAKKFTGKDFDKICKTQNSQWSKIRNYTPFDYTQYQTQQKAISRYNSDEILRKWVNQALNNKTHTSYFKDKTNFDQLSYAAKTWFYNIAKTIQKEAFEAAKAWFEIYKPYDLEKLPNESKLHEKLEEIKKEMEILA